MDDETRQEHLGRIKNESIRAAYKRLVGDLEAAGLSASPNSGRVSAVRFHNRGNEYLLSFIINAAHLLFYLRRPVLQHARDLPRMALEHHPGKTRVNNAGETTIRIDSQSDADILLSWLVPRLAAFL